MSRGDTPVRCSVIVGGTSFIGGELARLWARRGDEVIITGRDQDRAEAAAGGLVEELVQDHGPDLNPRIRGLGLDLGRPDTLRHALASVTRVDGLVLAASDTTPNSVAELDLEAATRAVVIKTVGYAETVRILWPRFSADAAVVLFGGLAKERPYPGSTFITTFNGAVTGLTRTLARELAPHRVNAIHPGVVGNTPRWDGVPDDQKPGALDTPIGRLVSVDEVVHATDFLLSNGAVNAVDLVVDGGLLIS